MTLRGCVVFGLGLSAAVVGACAVEQSAVPGGEGGAGAGQSTDAGNGTGTSAGGSLTITSVGAGGGDVDECDNVLPVTVRDFSEAHPDMEMAFSGDVVRLQLVQPQLGPDKRPVLLDTVGCPQDGPGSQSCAGWVPTQPVIASAQSFHQWYHSEDGVNHTFEKELVLAETAPGSMVFVYDSNAFFPLSPQEGFGPSPSSNNPQGLNYLFTTEIHVNFEYVQGQVFTFRGDDDLWIFVNDRLALDLGSMHSAELGTIDFDAQAAALGIQPGNTYSMDIFQAERHTTGSNFRFETNISCFTPVEVPK